MEYQKIYEHLGHKKKREKEGKSGEDQQWAQFAKWGGPLRADSMPADVFWPRIIRNKLFHHWDIQLCGRELQ